MPRKAREILKSRGYTDQELDGLILLNDARFCATLEAEDADREALLSERDQLKRTVDDTGRWYHETAKPTLERALADATNARAEKARLEARLQAETDYGLRQVAQDQDRNNQSGDQNQNRDQQRTQDQGNRNAEFDARYVTADTFTQATNQFGDAIAMSSDIIEDHRELFGSRLPGGISKLRDDYRNAVRVNHFSGNLRDYWESQYKVPDKRAELSAKARADQEAQIRQDERSKVMSEFANPMTRPLEGSRNPFVRKPAGGDSGKSNVGRQPWERGTQEQIRSDRVVRFATKVLNGKSA